MSADDAKVRVFLDDAKNAIVQAQEQLDKGNGDNAILAAKKAAATLIAATKLLQKDSKSDEAASAEDVVAENEFIARQVIHRLNVLLRDNAVRRDIKNLIETRIPCSEETADHPTIQVSLNPTRTKLSGYLLTKLWKNVASDNGGKPTFGFLGLLNGIVGVLPDGKHKGWGYIAAHFDDDNRLTHFYRTDQP